MIHSDAHPLQAGLEGRCQGLTVEPGQHHAGHIQTKIPEDANQANHIQIIGDAQVTPDFIFFNVIGVDGNDHLHMVFQLQQHPQLAVRLEAGQHPGGVIIVVQLAAKLQIQLAAECRNPLPDVLGLHLQIFIVIKPNFYHKNFTAAPSLCLSFDAYYIATAVQ